MFSILCCKLKLNGKIHLIHLIFCHVLTQNIDEKEPFCGIGDQISADPSERTFLGNFNNQRRSKDHARTK